MLVLVLLKYRLKKSQCWQSVDVKNFRPWKCIQYKFQSLLSATSLQSSYPYSFQELCFSLPASPSSIISMKGINGLWALALQASIRSCSTKQSDDKKTDRTHVWRLVCSLQVSGFKMWMLTVVYATNKWIGKNIIKN